MKKVVCVLSAVFCFGVIACSAKADTLKYLGSSSDIGPYQMQLNGTTNVNLFCLDDFRDISVGETWQASVYTGDHFYTTNTNSTNFKYMEEAYIYSMLGQSNGRGHIYTNTDVQQALWYIFDHNANTNRWADTLISNAGSFSYTTTFLDDYSFYIPTNWPHGYGQPQDMIGTTPSSPIAPTPEPSTLFLLGSGLIGAAGAIRRRISSRVS